MRDSISSRLSSFLFLGALGFSQVLHAQPAHLSLKDYQESALTHHLGLVATKESSLGATKRTHEGKLLTRPQLFGVFQYSDDKRVTMNPSFQGRQTQFTQYQIGVQEQFFFGPSAKLSYNINHTVIKGASPLFLPLNDFYDVFPRLEFTLPLWRNLFGSETRAQQTVLEAAGKILSSQSLAAHRGLLAQVELVYYRLGQAREMVGVQKEALERSKRIKDWNSRRGQLGLGDRADSLQAEAAYRYKELDVRAALQEEAALAREFNTLRGIDSESVTETLTPLDKEEVGRMRIPQRADLKDETRAYLETQNLAQAQAELGKERNKPVLEIYSSLSLNARNAKADKARSEAFQSDHPNDAVGVRFTAPLDVGGAIDVIQGYAQEKNAAELNYQRRLFEQEREWKDLVQKWEDSKERFDLALRIEEAQKTKLLYEKDRQQKGRSTTFQVLRFEQDFADAQLLRIRNETEILMLATKLRLFEPMELEPTKKEL